MPGSVSFDGTDVCSALGCVLSDVDMDPPKQKTSYVDVPGRSGSYDLSEALTGYPTFQDRDMKLRFYALADGRTDGEQLLSAATGMLHGKRGEIELSWDPGYRYVGRLSVGSLVRYADAVGFEVSAKCEPYKYKTSWTGKTVDSAGGVWAEFPCGAKPVVPEWTIYGNTEIRQEGSDITYMLGRGRYKLPDLLFTEGTNLVWLYSDEGGGTPRTIGGTTPTDIASHADEEIGSIAWVTPPAGWNVKAEYEWGDF